MGLPDFEQSRYRTLVDVVKVDAQKGTVDLLIPGWDPSVTVTIAAVRIQPPELLEAVRGGGFLLAQVNLAAENPDQLMLNSFEQAPAPMPEGQLR